MKQYKVRYNKITQSTYGAYVYKLDCIVEANSEDEAMRIFKEENKVPKGKRYKIVIKSVEELREKL